MKENEFELEQTPDDGITSLRFSPFNNELLIVSSWDKTVRVYKYRDNELISNMEYGESILDSCFYDKSKYICGGVEGSLNICDIEYGRSTTIGNHDDGIKCVNAFSDEGFIVSGSWDSSIKFWDIRTRECLGSYIQPERVYSMDTTRNQIIVGTAARHIWIWDYRSMDEPEQRRKSPLMHQTRCIRAFVDGQGFGVGSIEGRVGIEYIDASPSQQSKRYAFKCHRQDTNDVGYTYPVHAIAFHPNNEFLFTGGGDGLVIKWNYKLKTKIERYRRFHNSISSLDVNKTGEYLAIASSYCFEQGEKSKVDDKVFIKCIKGYIN